MDKVNGIDMEFIYKKRGPFPETKRLWVKKNHILKPDKPRIVGNGKDNELRPSQIGRKRNVSRTLKFVTVFPLLRDPWINSPTRVLTKQQRLLDKQQSV